MRKRSLTIIVVLLLVLIPACYYSDGEMYYVEPVAGDPPVFSVTTNLDTLYNPQVNDSLDVNYKVNIDGGELYYVLAVVANNMVYESDTTEGSFWLKPDLVTDSGVDTLFIDLYYSTNSNSLADKVGYEAILETLKFTIDFNLEDVK